MESIKSIVGAVLKNIENKNQSTGHNIEEVWVRCVKRGIAQHTHACFLKKGKLFVNVESPAWLYELKGKKEQILKKLKKTSNNKIKEISFRVGDIYDSRQ